VIARDPFLAPRALVFDLDGLLIDTEEACFQTARALLENHGAPAPSLTRGDYSAFVGRPINESYAALRDRYGLAAAVPELVAERNDHILGWYRAPALLPGAEALVREAHAAGMPLAIASAAPGPLVAAATEAMAIGKLFSAVVSADHALVDAPKPAPDVYLAACRLLGVAPAHATAIEDSPAGATAALAAGMATIVVPNEWTRSEAFPAGVVRRDSLVDVLGELPLPAR
jgi:HAD superfamily hydrolase (TIGR01509 family)